MIPNKIYMNDLLPSVIIIGVHGNGIYRNGKLDMVLNFTLQP